jgi:hypothetical protein
MRFVIAPCMCLLVVHEDRHRAAFAASRPCVGQCQRCAAGPDPNRDERAGRQKKECVQLDQCRASSSRILRSWSVTRDTNVASPRSSAKHSGWTKRPGAPRCASEVFDERNPVGLPFALWHVLVPPRSDAGAIGTLLLVAERTYERWHVQDSPKPSPHTEEVSDEPALQALTA